MQRLRMPYWHHCAPDGFVPFTHLYRLIDEGARQAGSDCFGTAVMEARPFTAWTGISRDLVKKPTLYTMLRSFVLWIPRYGSSKQWWLRETPGTVWLCRGGPSVCDVGERQMTLYALTGAVQLLRLAAGPSWKPKAVVFQGRVPATMQETDVFSDAKIHCDAAISAVAIPRTLLARIPPPPTRSGAKLRASVVRTLSAPPRTDFSGALRQVIETYLTERCLRINEAAEMAGLNVRTLQRRLEDEGKTYSQLVDEARFAAATKLLREPHNKIIDVAYDVGYANPTHFTRAFRRLAGISPREYRKQHLRSLDSMAYPH